MCVQYHLPLEPELLELLLDSCDANRDGYIDYIEFSNFLNWKDKMKSGLPDKSGKKKGFTKYQPSDFQLSVISETASFILC